MTYKRKNDLKPDKLFRNSRPTKQERLKEEDVVYCSRCGEKLTSPRAIKNEEGQRCRWARMEEEGTRVYRKTKGPHMKEDVSFSNPPQGTKVKSGVVVQYVQTKLLGDW